MVTSDSNLQKLLFKGRTLEEFDAIARRPEYRNVFPAEKWSLIVQSLANAAFVRRLDKMIDRRVTNEQGPIAEADPMVHRRFAKRDDGGPRKAPTEEIAQRIFTRDSYYRVKESVEPGKTPRDDTAERSTTEIIEAAPALMHGSFVDSSGSHRQAFLRCRPRIAASAARQVAVAEDDAAAQRIRGGCAHPAASGSAARQADFFHEHRHGAVLLGVL
jgi:hypothetical protein